MELAEKRLKKFEDEGFSSVYDRSDQAGTVYEKHAHRGKVSLFVTDGDCTFDFGETTVKVSAGERFDVPVGAEHSAVVGEQGWIVVVGEEIKGDS